MKHKDIPLVIITMMALAALIVAVWLSFDYAHAAAPTYYVAVSESAPLNVREAPSKEANVLIEVERGTALIPTGRTDGLWVEIYTECYTYYYREGQEVEKVGPHNGWVNIQYLSEEQPYDGLTGTVTGGGKVCFRSEPVKGEKTVLRKLEPGAQVAVLSVFEYSGERWYRVRAGEERGFMMSQYVEVLK